MAVGSQVRRHLPGDVVIVPYQVSCGRCRSCRAGTFAACATRRAPAGASFGFGVMGGDHGGAVADLLAVPEADHLLVTAPRGVPIAALATLSDNVVDGYRAVAPPLSDQPGAQVLIVADVPGSVALYAAAAAAAPTPGRVCYIDTDPERFASLPLSAPTPLNTTGLGPAGSTLPLSLSTSPGATWV